MAAKRDAPARAGPVSNASAYTLYGQGCRYDPANDNDGSYSSSKRDLRVQWANLGSSTGGSLTRWCGSDHYTQDPRFRWGANATYYSSTEGRRQAIAIHEIGHSYGVTHTTTPGCTDSSDTLMHSDPVGKYDLCGWGAPRPDTVSGATAAHNGNW